MLSAAASSSPSPVIRTIRLVSSSPAASQPPFPHNVLAPLSSPFTLRFPATSTQQQLGPTSISVDSSGFATRFLMANPVASQIGQARSTIVTSSLSTPPVQPAYVQAMGHNTSSTVSGTPSYFSELFAARHSNPGRLDPGEVFPVNEQYNIVQPGIQSAQFPTPSLEFSPFFGGPGNSAGIGKTGFSSGFGKFCRFNRPCRRTNRAGSAFVFSVGRPAGCSPRQKEEIICIRGRVASRVWGVYANSDGLSYAAHLFVFRNDSQSCYNRIRWFPIDSLFASIRFSRLFAFMLYSHSVGFVVIRYLHLFVFRNDSQSCYIRIPLVSH